MGTNSGAQATYRALTHPELCRLAWRVWGALLRGHRTSLCALKAARAEGLAPLLAASGIGPGHGGAPDRLGELIGVALQEVALAISNRLGSHGLAHAFMKGAAVAPLYGATRARPMSDIDILVGEAGLPQAVDALRPLGYRVVSSTELAWTLLAQDKLLPTVDLHRDLGYKGQFAFQIDRMLACAWRPFGLSILRPEDELLALAAHIARHRFFGVGRSLCDMAVLTMTCHVNWDALIENARAWRVSAAAWASLMCARKVFGARVQQEVLECLRPGACQEAWMRAFLDLGRLSPWRFSSRGSGRLARRAALVALWPASSDGLASGLMFAVRYSLRMLFRRGVAPEET